MFESTLLVSLQQPRSFMSVSPGFTPHKYAQPQHTQGRPVPGPLTLPLPPRASRVYPMCEVKATVNLLPHRPTGASSFHRNPMERVGHPASPQISAKSWTWRSRVRPTGSSFRLYILAGEGWPGEQGSKPCVSRAAPDAGVAGSLPESSECEIRRCETRVLSGWLPSVTLRNDKTKL